jgi:tellurite resistance protein TerC
MHVTGLWWAGTFVALVALLALDVLVTSRQKRAPSTSEAARWVLFYVSAAIVFGCFVVVGFGGDYGGQFFAGWLTEYSLSVDNLFVFMVLMARFAVPPNLQLRVLTIGIVLALVLRGILIAVGAAAVERFSWVFLIFGAFLLWTAWGLVRENGRDDENDSVPTVDGVPAPPPDSRVVRLIERTVPTTRTWHGTRLLARVNGRTVVTPMLLTMVAIGFTDVLFALDSIPAIFGLTKEPFLVIAANGFALLGLRQLYFLVGGLVDRLIYLNKGLSFVLAFIGVKLILEALHTNHASWINGGEPVEWAPEIPVLVSLGVVIGTLLITALASIVVLHRRRRALDRELPADPTVARTAARGGTA